MNVAFKRKFPIGSSHMKLIDVLKRIYVVSFCAFICFVHVCRNRRLALTSACGNASSRSSATSLYNAESRLANVTTKVTFVPVLSADENGLLAAAAMPCKFIAFRHLTRELLLIVVYRMH